MGQALCVLGTEKEVSGQQEDLRLRISNMPGFSETNLIGYGKNNTNNTKQGKTSKEFPKRKKNCQRKLEFDLDYPEVWPLPVTSSTCSLPTQTGTCDFIFQFGFSQLHAVENQVTGTRRDCYYPMGQRYYTKGVQSVFCARLQRLLPGDVRSYAHRSSPHSVMGTPAPPPCSPFPSSFRVSLYFSLFKIRVLSSSIRNAISRWAFPSRTNCIFVCLYTLSLHTNQNISSCILIEYIRQLRKYVFTVEERTTFAGSSHYVGYSDEMHTA